MYPRLSEEQMFEIIAEDLHILPVQVSHTVELLDDGNTVPFIARYRKEVTGKLDEEQIREIQVRLNYFRILEDRKQTVLKTIDEQGKLTPALQAKISRSRKLQEVEDLYLPYKPKRKTRATTAKAKGLEPLALLIWNQETTEGTPGEFAQEYVNDEKEVRSPEEALQGAEDIVAEMISDNADIRQLVRKFVLNTGMLVSAGKTKDRTPYEMYYEYKELVKRVRPHRLLAINRGEKETVLKVKIEVDEDALLRRLELQIVRKPNSIFTEHLQTALTDAYHRLLFPAIEREVRSALTEKAEAHAINVFAKNLRNLLMQPPITGKVIMGIDPGYRTGCKVAVIDKTGKYLEGTTIFPHPPQNQWNSAKGVLWELINKYYVDVIAIGNGTASRETEQLAAQLIHEKARDVVYIIVSEAGASVYSASPLARREFPDLEASMRGNISIARRLLDPLAELVKIEPKSIGVGMYQHDVNQKKLTEALHTVVESVVNHVGVDLNTASAALLKYVSGLNTKLAEAIVAYRDTHGKFANRKELLDIKGMGTKSFEQGAGFLRIPGGENLFDNTAIHPESYEAARKLLERLNLDLKAIQTHGNLLRQKIDDGNFSYKDLAETVRVGEYTLMDIIENLEKPGRDPRAELPPPIFRSDVLKMEDLRQGMLLKGTVRNVVDFGAFVDIGVKQDGLVHRSEMGQHTRNPLDRVSVGDIIDVRVLDVDLERGRVALSMNLEPPSAPLI